MGIFTQNIEETENMKIGRVVVLLALCIMSATTSPMSKRFLGSNPKKDPYINTPEVPTLEDLERGFGTGDPTDNFSPVLKMENGKIKEESRDMIEQYNVHHVHENLDETQEEDKISSEMAYKRLVQAIIDGDNEAIAKERMAAATFMSDTGLTYEDAKKEAEEAKNKNNGRNKRYLSKMNNGYWDKCIVPYEWGEGFTDYSRVIPQMRKYEYFTGFRFVEWNESVPAIYGLPHNNRLKYIDDGNCWSYVGNRRGSGQYISCCSGTACVHEIGHALGFMHEQMSPLREDHVRFEWDGIRPDYWRQYYRRSFDSSVVFGYYDLTSVMHYYKSLFRVNYKTTMTTLDPDEDFLIASDSRNYYFFKEAMEEYKCFDLFCSDSLECENGGYPSVVKGECMCICPYGLNPETQCRHQEYTNLSLAELPWPAGSFTILNTVDGCPEGFKLGYLYHVPPRYTWASTPYNAKPDWSSNYAEHEFCSRIDEQNAGPAWPEGSYCIFRKGGSCPPGFETGFIQMDNSPADRENTTAGELPDGEYGENSRWEFCCRADLSAHVPIKFPTKQPFILFNDYECQNVEGMRSSSEYFNWRSDTADNYHNISGKVPRYLEFSTGHFNLYFCYYIPINQSCGGIYTLNSSHTSNPLNIQSMNYPQPYETHLDCTFTILAPENTTIQLDFDGFDINCDSDSVDIAFTLPGHPGYSYCGSGFEKSIVSKENYMRVTLRSGTTQGSSSGFSASVRLIDKSSKCFTNMGKDRSYSGDMSYTKNFEPCLPWHEVKECRFHRFTPETFDDDLVENFCRNTGVGTDPWCYTNAETCARDYCDACSTRSCYDLFDDCSDLIANEPSFCSTNQDGQALRGCRKSCDKCIVVETNTTCPPPGNVDKAVPTPVKNVYSVGDQVEYVCPTANSTDVRKRTCTSSGTWTYLNFVCGACPVGWYSVDGQCYRWFDTYLNYSEALQFCEGLDAGLPIVRSQNQSDFIRKIVQTDKEVMDGVWLGMYKGEGGFKWNDGTDLTFTQWLFYEPGSSKDCASFYVNGWVTYPCSNTKNVVCMYTPSERTTCADQTSHCEDFIRATPDLCVRQTDFAYANCPFSCGICGSEVSVIGKREIVPNEIKSNDIDKGSQRMTSEDIREPRQPVKRCFDDCITFPPATTTTIDSTTSASTMTSTTESHSATTQAQTTQEQCIYPTDLSINTQLVAGFGDITRGQVYVYQCDDGFTLAFGDLIRACLGSGQLTGSAPICEPESTVEQPVNDVNIRRRSRHGDDGYIYTAVNQDLRITKTGKLTKWRFYSSYTGDISLQVWRFAPGDTTYGTFIGKNLVTNTGNDRLRTIEIPVADQIMVQDGDVIAVHYPGSNSAGISYTRCDLDWEPNQNNQLRSSFDADFLFEGNSYLFEDDFYDCKTWSLNAFIR